MLPRKKAGGRVYGTLPTIFVTSCESIFQNKKFKNMFSKTSMILNLKKKGVREEVVCYKASDSCWSNGMTP